MVTNAGSLPAAIALSCVSTVAVGDGAPLLLHPSPLSLLPPSLTSIRGVSQRNDSYRWDDLSSFEVLASSELVTDLKEKLTEENNDREKTESEIRKKVRQGSVIDDHRGGGRLLFRRTR